MTTAGLTLRAEGQSAVLAADTHVLRGYGDLVKQTVAAYPQHYQFHAEDIRQEIDAAHPGAQPHSPNVLPAVLGGLAAAGRIRAVGHVQCTRTSRRAGWMRVWEVAPTTQQ